MPEGKAQGNYATVWSHFPIICSCPIRVLDLWNKNVTHSILASPEQMNFLWNAGTWYFDGTFNVVRYLSVQPFRIHSFHRCSKSVKRVSLINVIMSCKTKENYSAIFWELIRSLNEDINSEECVLNFELAAWITLGESLTEIW